jgi:hypothetical protein
MVADMVRVGVDGEDMADTADTADTAVVEVTVEVGAEDAEVIIKKSR